MKKLLLLMFVIIFLFSCKYKYVRSDIELFYKDGRQIKYKDLRYFGNTLGGIDFRCEEGSITIKNSLISEIRIKYIEE